MSTCICEELEEGVSQSLLSPLIPPSTKEAVPEVCVCPVSAKEAVFELSACPVSVKEALL